VQNEIMIVDAILLLFWLTFKYVSFSFEFKYLKLEKSDLEQFFNFTKVLKLLFELLKKVRLANKGTIKQNN